MRYRATLVALVVLASAAAAGAAILHESRDLDETIRSIALNGRVHARVVLPPGYSDSRERYPVVYFLHGLPANAAAYRGNDWVIDELERAGPAILVIPQGARAGDRDPEYLNWGAGRNWETYVATEVPRYVDAHFRTIRSRSGRAIVGVSAGGYGAMILGLHHLAEFSVIESWSGYFHPTDPTGTVSLPREPAASARNLVGDLESSEQRLPTFVSFYVGRGDTRFRSDNVRLDAELTTGRIPHTFDLYPGSHTTALWKTHGTAWLRLALRHLAAPR
ncbi:MAG TPA: alpha/beta hydrolase-fold protein [Gaiellaceae bacterium]